MKKEFLIGSWVTYHSYDILDYEAQTKRLVDLGFNYNPFPFDWYKLETHDSLVDYLEIDRINKKYGLYYGIEVTQDKCGESDEALELIKNIKNNVSEYGLYSHIKDEPTSQDIDTLAYWVKKYKKEIPGIEPIFNLFPSYVSVRTLNNSYIGHLKEIVEKVGKENITFLGNDYYPFYENETKYRMFCDLEDIRKVAYENGKLKTHEFIQGGTWKGMRMPTIEEISWQCYSFIAYGVKALSYFNLVCPIDRTNFKDSLIMTDGTINDPKLLEDVGKLNFEIRALGNELIDTDTVHAYHTNPKKDQVELLPSDYFITPIDKELEVIITEHDDKTLFMIVNADLDFEGEAKFKINTNKKILVFDCSKGKYVDAMFADGILNIYLKKGKGFLFKLN